MRATFYLHLHNGAVFGVDVEKISRTTRAVTEETTGFSWTSKGPGTDELFYIRVEQVDAITIRDEPAGP